jgi:hypothetical protein
LEKVIKKNDRGLVDVVSTLTFLGVTVLLTPVVAYYATNIPTPSTSTSATSSRPRISRR